MKQMATNCIHITVLATAMVVGLTGWAVGQVGLVDFDGTNTGLTSYSNDALVNGGISTNGNLAFNETFALFASSGDAFNPMSRASLSPTEADGDQAGMPFAISDDSVVAATGNSVFATDAQGFAGDAKMDGFFGVTDNVNSTNPTGMNSADFVFNISGFSSLTLAMDFAAMGSFELDDLFDVSYDIDGGGFTSVFSGSPVAGVMQTYFMDSGFQVDLPDPYSINGTILGEDFQTLVAGIVGTGSSLTVRVTAMMDGGTEALGFDNVLIRGVPEPSSLALLAIGGLAWIRRTRRVR